MARFNRPPTAGAAVLEELRRAIIQGELKPGYPIRAEQIAERLGVSRVPVREALFTLEGEGQVSYEPHRGYFVADLSLSDLKELYLVRHLLEAEALRRSVPKLDDEDFVRVEEVMRELDHADSSIDIHNYVAANRRFHLAFLEQLEMPRLSRQIENLYNACDTYGSVYYNRQGNRARSEKEHRAMLKAARKREADKLVELLGTHRRAVIDALEPVLADGGATESSA